MELIIVCILIICISCLLLVSLKTCESFSTNLEPIGITQAVKNSNSLITYDPTNSSCAYYVDKYKPEYRALFSDSSDKGIRRRIALAMLVAARGKIAAQGESNTLSYLDGCVIPPELMSILSLSSECRLSGTDIDTQANFDMTLKKSLPAVAPQGCIIDFGGALEPSSKALTEDEFYKILDNIYNNLNRKLVEEIKRLITERDRYKTDLANKTQDFDDLTVQHTKVVNERDNNANALQTCNTDLDTKKREYTSLSGSYDNVISSNSTLSSKLSSYKSNAPLLYLFNNNWFAPVRGNVASSIADIGMFNQLSKTIIFRILIQNYSSNWRNIFHVTTGDDLYRRPAAFIHPQSSQVHICHDTEASNNEATSIYIPFNSDVHVALVWSKQTLEIYVNGGLATTQRYSDTILSADSYASLYLCDNFYDQGGFLIRDFRIYNYTMTQNMVRETL